MFTGLTALITLFLARQPRHGRRAAAHGDGGEGRGRTRRGRRCWRGRRSTVDFTPAVANGSLPASDTKLAVAAGSVDGTAETVTRTSGTMAAVTVDIDLTTQPSLPTDHRGYEFAKATSGLPKEILPDTTGPQNFTAKPGDEAGRAGVGRAAGRLGRDETPVPLQKTGTGSYPATWIGRPEQRGGRRQRGRLHGAEPHQRDGIHLQAPAAWSAPPRARRRSPTR